MVGIHFDLANNHLKISNIPVIFYHGDLHL